MKALLKHFFMGVGVFWTFVAPFSVAHTQPTVTPTQRSSFADMRASTQALQQDDAQNPAMLWVETGQQLMHTPPAAGQPSCTSCHSAAKPLGDVAARYPALDAATQRPLTLAAKVNACRSSRQGQQAWGSEHPDLLAITAALGFAARSQAIAPMPAASHPALRTAHAEGARWFNTRLGQLNLSCAQCHNERPGLSLGGTTIPQGHPTGYPIYRLEWQGMGSLARRIRGCMTGVRAEPFAANSPEMTALEVYLAQRATGMAIETPAVRP